jgi:pimeloyl-ACP methyl ester carboxylesterase
MKKFITRLLIIATLIYSVGCGYMYFAQESFIFHPEKISSTTKIEFSLPAELINIPVEGANLSGALFKVEKPKGLIFFLHGNAGNLLNQENAAKFYTTLGYDFFTVDYRSFGKSTGEMKDEKQFFEDVQTTYNLLKKSYNEDSITIIGYSVGTAPAANLASTNNAKKLILIAPYYSLVDMTTRKYKIIPTFLLKYKFETYKYIQKVKSPILIIHGNIDSVIPFEASQQLSKLLKKGDEFYPIKNQGHDDFENNSNFLSAINLFLEK